MSGVRRAFAALLLLGSFVAVPATTAHAQQVYPNCFVISSYGAGTLSPTPGPTNGTGSMVLEASYADQYNAYPAAVHMSYQTESQYRSGASTSDFTVTMTVNGSSFVAQTPKTGYSPGYYLHSDWAGGYSNGGVWRPWVKNDIVTVRVNVLLHPTLSSGYTEATCRL